MGKVKAKKPPQRAVAAVKPLANETFVVGQSKDASFNQKSEKDTKNGREKPERLKESEEEELEEELEEEEEMEESSEGGEVSESISSKISKKPKSKVVKKGSSFRLQGEGSETKPQANLGKVLKAKGRNQKTTVKEKSEEREPNPPKNSVLKNQKMLSVVLSGLSAMDTKKGVSFPALKKYILEEDASSNAVGWERVRSKIRAALEQGLQEDLIVRPKGSENVSGLQGSFKINKVKYSSRTTKQEKNKDKKENTMPVKSSKDKSENTSMGKSKLGIIKKTLKKPKESEVVKKKTMAVSKIKHRRSISEDFFWMKHGSKKRLMSSQSLEELAQLPKKEIPSKKVKKKK